MTLHNQIGTEQSAAKQQGAPGEPIDSMAKYGITRVRVDQFHYKEYRYSKLSDAVAQARRDGGASCNPDAIVGDGCE